MKSRPSTIAACLLLSLSALASLHGARAAPTDDDGSSAAAKVSAADKEFFRKAAVGGMTEVSAGKLAVEKGSSATVRKFGQRMIDDHGKAGEQLKALAAQKNVALPTEPDPTHQAMLNGLKAKTGADFDQAFVVDMKSGHTDAIATFKAASESKDPDIAKFATATLPTLQDHADHIPAAAAKTGM